MKIKEVSNLKGKKALSKNDSIEEKDNKKIKIMKVMIEKKKQETADHEHEHLTFKDEIYIDRRLQR